jgi:6-phosphogluconolactonase (cycloisomerase 2 family)
MNFMKALPKLLLGGALLAALTSCKDDLDLNKFPTGTVCTLSNQVSGNQVIQYLRLADGSLRRQGFYATGGTGSGAGLGSQGSLVISTNDKWLFAVNAGSNEISVLQVAGLSLPLKDIVPSGGTLPISLTQYGSWLYVLNAGGDGNISGFRIGTDGHLSPIANSTRPLSSPLAGPAQVQFTRDGLALIVTEKATHIISTYPVDANGVAGTLKTHPAAGRTPFGFALGPQGQFFVSEASGGAANQSTLSSYAIDAAGNVSTLDGPDATHQTAACWVVATGNGSLVYTTNAGSGTVSGFRVDPAGRLDLLRPDGISASTGPESGPNDAALSRNDRYLYVLETGSHAISSYRVDTDGSLSPVDEDTGLPAGAVGLATR